MGKKSWVDKNHYRSTSDDGSTSYLYEVSGIMGTSTCVEVADHHDDGTTTAYEYDPSFRASLFSGGRGSKK